MVSLCFYRFVSIIPYISTILAVQVHPVKRSIVSPATCSSEYSWMDDGQGDSPCLTVAYVEAACSGSNNYDQPVLKNGYSYSLPNSTTANPCYCSWSSYNLMMACTICQNNNDSAIWEWAQWTNGCTTNSSWTEKYFPSGYVLAGNASIPYWAITDPTTWTSATFNIIDANATYQKNPSYIIPSPPSSSSGPSSSSSSSKSIDVGAIVGGTIGGAAALLLLAIGAYILYRRHVYRKGVHVSAINQQGTTFMSSSGTHSRFPSDTSNFAPSMSGPLALYGQSVSPPPPQNEIVYSSQPQTTYPSLQGSFSPLPQTNMSVYTTYTGNGQRSDVIPMV
ncbi:uncharacterized protein BJ212DRAFT_368455 [Suillus subaureus]|uniref:Transmembrane protein n=1 Tax=Suillus subaureus TaxID=48587 RepID=A0A9P7E910_9AGAM|nr:uncharacterized protein BJ212DRAFT_368455 [Suillus subaureus]KAG1814372.1 hypothetical protein BJ212DRAFT_368455 [Suillus subaureus]